MLISTNVPEAAYPLEDWLEVAETLSPPHSLFEPRDVQIPMLLWPLGYLQAKEGPGYLLIFSKSLKCFCLIILNSNHVP